MVDVPHALRLDVAHEPALADGVRHVGGEPRALQLYPEPGQAARRVRALGGRSGSGSGPGSAPARRCSPTAGSARSPRATSRRIGEVVVVMRDAYRRRRLPPGPARAARPLGLHGSITEDEVAVPGHPCPPAATA